jgi:hypothetical protein
MRLLNKFIIVWILTFVFGSIGWVTNIIKLADHDGSITTWGGMEIVRVIGVFVLPLGGIAGWF